MKAKWNRVFKVAKDSRHTGTRGSYACNVSEQVQLSLAQNPGMVKVWFNRFIKNGGKFDGMFAEEVAEDRTQDKEQDGFRWMNRSQALEYKP